MKNTKNDPINSPVHYSGKIECIEAIEASMTPEAFKGFLKGNCLKYLYRYENKNKLEDLRKCQWYLERLIFVIDCEGDTVQKVAAVMEEALDINYDPDDYMASGCPDGFCPMPGARQGPSEPFFPPVHDA